MLIEKIYLNEKKIQRANYLAKIYLIEQFLINFQNEDYGLNKLTENDKEY